MPITPTYPGVYIEELPSAVRTIAGVSTAITAFVGYTRRGPIDRAVRVLSYGDFERAFGGLDRDAPMAYAVQHFFQNGGGEAHIVRVADGAIPASMDLEDDGGATVLHVEAATRGIWGNLLRVEVDYATASPSSTFNLTVTEFRRDGAALVPGDQETFRNLSMNSQSPMYVERVVTASKLVRATRTAGLAFTAAGTVTTAPADLGTAAGGPGFNAALDALGGEGEVLVSVDGGPFEPVTVTVPGGTNAGTRFNTLAGAIATAVQAQTGKAVTGSGSGGAGAKVATFRSPTTDERSSLRFAPAPSNDLARIMRLTPTFGATEVEGAAARRPRSTGTLGAPIATLPTAPPAGETRGVRLTVAAGGASTDVDLQVLAPGEAPATVHAAATHLQQQIVAAASATTTPAGIRPVLAGTTVRVAGARLHVRPGTPGGGDARISFADASTTDTTATTLGLAGAAANNASYSPSAPTDAGQATAALGADGTVPGATGLRGSEAAKTGLHALADVDLFNLLCIPEAARLPDEQQSAVLSEAATYCERRRAFLLVDPPDGVDDLEAAEDWIRGTLPPSTNHGAAFFPRLTVADPLDEFRARPMAPSGALAGLFARTDRTRGVWKAPAGTEATLNGALGASTPLTDEETGVLNPLGLNVIRTLPIHGTVNWGARTLEGADQQASQWKYVPVRRTALYIEESLYRGTQWVVFEPNDEPLWSQIRLNVGAFMHSLFRQGAFQGLTPRDAYLVKCDTETTTQDDVNRGIVNIVVGFAPLKPAEFVILKITQLAGRAQAAA